MYNPPRVGIAVILEKDTKILLGKRQGAHGAGCWGFPGGHLEYGETVADCAIRETYEETGLTITNTQAYWFTEDFFSKEQRHYITIFVHAQVQSGTLNVQEPDKCLCWEWCDREALPQPLFSPIEQLLATKGL